ncbi:plasmid recombination protein [Nitrincola schmidtii]|uniref:plasmid recombination protein n=1 Tax=Nitrincola schmidtii TaxID=1730894 RepID=UPI00124D2C36|nr:plasmid recombination protein [Nitrincola schmidtii]
MAGFQFIHYEAYARTGNAKKRSLLSIAQEANRDTGSHPHVTAPQPPEYLKGTSFIESAEAIIHAADNSKVIHGGKKRNIRKDANVGIGLIASHPTSIEDINSMSELDRTHAIDEIKQWADDTIKFAEAEFNGLVLVAAIHWDESHPHIHILIGDVEPSDDFKIIHKGEQARKAAQGNDRTALGKKLGNNAYTAEMRRFQDKYHDDVAIFYGQARLGPKRRRKSRAEWKKEQAQLDLLAKSLLRGKSIDHLVDEELAKASDQAQLMIDATQEEIDRQKKLTDRQKSLADDQLVEARRLKEQAELDAREAADLKKEVVKLKSTLDERIRQMSKYDGVLGKFLGWLGITQRIEKKAEDRLNGQLSKLRDKVDELSRQVGKEKSMQRQHRVTEDALKSLQRALSVSVDDYPQLKEKGALEKHFEQIQKIVIKNKSVEDFSGQIDAYFDQLTATSQVLMDSSLNEIIIKP